MLFSGGNRERDLGALGHLRSRRGARVNDMPLFDVGIGRFPRFHLEPSVFEFGDRVVLSEVPHVGDADLLVVVSVDVGEAAARCVVVVVGPCDGATDSENGEDNECPDDPYPCGQCTAFLFALLGVLAGVFAAGVPRGGVAPCRCDGRVCSLRLAGGVLSRLGCVGARRGRAVRAASSCDSGGSSRSRGPCGGHNGGRDVAGIVLVGHRAVRIGPMLCGQRCAVASQTSKVVGEIGGIVIAVSRILRHRCHDDGVDVGGSGRIEPDAVNV